MGKDERRSPALSHVCMLTPHGWEHVTVEDALDAGAAGTVSAHSGHFMCELCGQYVTLAHGNKYVPYFKHSAYEKSKNCPERTSGIGYTPTYDPNNYELPLRICNISPDGFMLQLGLLYVPEELLHSAKKQNVVITPCGAELPFTYNFIRLNTASISYLDVGCTPASAYQIECDDTLRYFWPSTVKGASPSGSVFDARTGKLLPTDADVGIGSTYYILSTRTFLPYIPSMQVKKISVQKAKSATWYLYEVLVLEMSERAALFFLDMHYRLTENPVRLQPIWPVYRKSPYTIQHGKDFLYFHLQMMRKTTLKTFPSSTIQRYTCSGSRCQIARIQCSDRQQVISMGQINILQYTYFWKTPLNEETELPHISVCDLRKEPVSSGELSELPFNGTLVIIAPYSGEILIRKNGVLVDRRLLKPETRTEINNLSFGCHISILQGLDNVFDASFIYPPKESPSTDERLLLKRLQSSKGKSICIPHSLGASSAKLTHFPLIKQWLYLCIRRGTMPEDALRIFKHFLTEI